MVFCTLGRWAGAHQKKPLTIQALIIIHIYSKLDASSNDDIYGTPAELELLHTYTRISAILRDLSVLLNVFIKGPISRNIVWCLWLKKSSTNHLHDWLHRSFFGLFGVKRRQQWCIRIMVNLAIIWHNSQSGYYLDIVISLKLWTWQAHVSKWNCKCHLSFMFWDLDCHASMFNH